MDCGALVRPAFAEVMPVPPEPIVRQDGANKNDCERNAAKRFLANFREDHPFLPVIVVEDGLSSNGPHIEDLKSNNMRYILGAKAGDHGALFARMEAATEAGTAHTLSLTDPDTGTIHHFRW